MNLTYEQLLPMLKMQDQLNRLIDPEWVQAKYPWLRAAWLESGELMEHVGWKWWKHQERNTVQAQIELVDIWHFMLSEWLGNTPKDEDVESAAALLIESMYAPEKWTPVQDEALQRHTDLHVMIDSFAHLCSANIFNVKIFERIMQLLNMSWSDMYRMYVAKNVLNIFRQHNGYKLGTYIKDWAGKEDNVVLEELMAAQPNASPEELMAQLAVKYAEVTKT